MKDDWKEWLDNRINILSTPLGAGVSICGFIIGILIGNLILSAV